MRVELRCPRCSSHLRAAPDTPASAILDRMAEEGLWYALGDGETFEDMIFASLTEHGAIYCPECAVPVDISEESLGQLALQFLMATAQPMHDRLTSVGPYAPLPLGEMG